MRAGLLLGLTALAAACAAPGLAPGDGWSRAPDLSAYSAMRTFATVAREESSLCYGYSPATVSAEWARDFGPREEAVTAALIDRHGEASVAQAEARSTPTRRAYCPEVQDWRWRQRYSELLRLLEMRLGLA